MKILEDIQTSCDQRFQAIGINAKTYLLPGGLGLKLLGNNHKNLHQLYSLPIIECDLSDLNFFEFNLLNREKIFSLVLPSRFHLPFSSLRGFNLSSLRVQHAQSNDFDSLSEQPLEVLELSGSLVEDLKFCEKMPLRRINLSGTRVKELKHLSNAKITYLNLFRTNVEDIGALNCKNIEEIVLSGTAIHCIQSLSESTKLRKLEIRGTPVSDLSPLANTQITELHLPGSKVKTIDCLAYLPIEKLNIIGLALNDLSSLSTLPLKFLALSPELLIEDDYDFLSNLKVPFLRGPNDPEDQTAEVFFQKYLVTSNKD